MFETLLFIENYTLEYFLKNFIEIKTIFQKIKNFKNNIQKLFSKNLEIKRWKLKRHLISCLQKKPRNTEKKCSRLYSKYLRMGEWRQRQL